MMSWLYPEYWKLNTNLGLQPASSIYRFFAQRYPQSAMAEKLATDYVEEKVKTKPVLMKQNLRTQPCH